MLMLVPKRKHCECIHNAAISKIALGNTFQAPYSSIYQMNKYVLIDKPTGTSCVMMYATIISVSTKKLV